MKTPLAPKSTPYQVFLHLMMMVMFYVFIISLMALLIEYINFLLPDPLLGLGSYNVVRSMSSALMVTFPVFLLTSWLIRKTFEVHPEQRHMEMRRWLIYFTLFVAGITMVVDLIKFVNGFYSGELTLAFFLKLLIVLILSLMSFGYFLWDLSETGLHNKGAKTLVLVSSVSLLLILGLGFVLAGSPSHQRALRFDEQRLWALQSIESEIGYYWREKNELPSQTSDLEHDLYGFQVPLDPETQEPYPYQVTGDLSFQLCAVFSMSYEDVPVSTAPFPYERWDHSAGLTCFDRTIDPDFLEK